MTWRKMNARDWASFVSYLEPDDGDVSPAVASGISNTEFTSIDGDLLGTDSNYGTASSTTTAPLGYLAILDVIGTQANTPTLSDGYKATDVKLNGGTYPVDMSDVLAITKYGSRNAWGLNTAAEMAHLKLAIEHPHYDAWQGEYEVGTHGGMAHRWSDMGEAYGLGLVNIRAADVRSTTFYGDGTGAGWATQLRTGNDSASNYIRNNGWFRKYPKYMLLDGTKGQSRQATVWATKQIPPSVYKDFDGVNVRLVFLYRNGLVSSSYTGDMQLSDIRIGQYSENNTAAQKVYNFATTNESFTTVGYTQSYNTNTVVTNDRAADGFNIGYASSLNWGNIATGSYSSVFNRDASGTGSSGTGLTNSANGSYYIYAETSGSSTGGRFYGARSPTFQFYDDPYSTPSYATGKYGANMGEMRVYFEIMPPVVTQNSSYTGNIIQSNNTNAFLNGVIVPPEVRGRKCRLVFAYISASSYASDFQLANFHYNSTSFAQGNGTHINLSTQGEQGYYLYTMGSSPTINNSVILEKYMEQPRWYNAGINTTSTGYWNTRNQGTNTPSGSTGVSTVGNTTLDPQYVYYEASSGGFAYKMKLFRTPEFVVQTGSSYCHWMQGSYMANQGKLYVYFIYGDTMKFAGSSN